MKTMIRVLGMAVATSLLGGAASAATVGWTEGKREVVLGTTRLSNEAPNVAPGRELGTVTAEDSIELYGRIVSKIDYYKVVTLDVRTTVEWIFEGYETVGGTVVTDSGLDVTPGAMVNLAFDGVGVAGNTFSSDVFASNGGDQFIATLMPGTYSFSVDGLNAKAALYDIRFTAAAVPLPAGGVLLLTGLAGLGIARRRKG